MVVDALDQAWQAWAELGSRLDDQQWNRPTRLDGWNVKHVYAHHCGFPGGAAAAIEAPPVTAAVTHADAAELLTFMQQPGGIADSVADDLRQHSLDFASQHSIDDMVEQFTKVAPKVIADLREFDLTRPIDYGGLAVISSAEALRITLLEAVVHYFDMAIALDLPVPGPLAGEPTSATTRLLAELADPVALIDAATGRGAPPVFPVMH
jgi:uncharacterized protein (TIGR03083 family)